MPTLHPSLLIAFGGFGRDVTTRLLWSAAARGVLPRVEGTASEGLRRRRIRDLEAILVPVRGEAGTDPHSQTGLLTDLRRQIVQIEGGDGASAALALAVDVATNRLLRADDSAGAPAQQRGLDVYVLVHIDSPATLGEVWASLRVPMSELSQAKALQPVAQGAPLLSVVLVLDVTEFWGRTAPMIAVRRAIRNVISESEDAVGEQRWGFSKVHLLDGDAVAGRRAMPERVDEAALLLEFLLYEGLRDDPALRTLVERSSNAEAPLISVGIRSIERSTSRLSRLAAAAFGAAWMGWIQRIDSATEKGRQEADLLIAELEMDEDRIAGTEAALNGVVRKQLAAFCSHATERLSEETWPARVHAAALNAERTLEHDLYAWADERRRAAGQEQIGQLRDAVARAVETLLAGSEPVPLAAILARLRALRARLGQVVLGGETPRPLMLDGIEEASLDWHQFRVEQLDPLADRPWWLAYSAFLGAAVMPAVGASLQLDPGSMGGAWAFLVLCVVGVVAVAVHFGQFRPLLGRVRRAGDFHVHAERGRLVSVVRSQIVEGGALSVRFFERAARAREDLVGSVRALGVREIDGVIGRLDARLREVRWLQGQLVDFLRQNDVDPQTLVCSPRTTPNRHAMEQRDEVLRFLQIREPRPSAFVMAMQSDHLLQGWDAPYADILLDPLRFLDDQSGHYPEPGDPLSVQVQRRRDEQIDVVASVIAKAGMFKAPFRWMAEAGATSQRYATVPAEWAAEPRIARALDSAGFRPEQTRQGASTDRCYLLTVSTNIDVEALGTT